MSAMQPAWVLGRKNYGDNGLLVEFLTAEAGRCGVVARGVFRRKTGGSLASILQPFHPLLIRLAGRGELKTLAAAESPTPAYVLRGDHLLSGLYLNELLTRLLPRFDPHPAVFLSYGDAVESLHDACGEIALRRFELILLTELGYRIEWRADVNQDAIKDCVEYLYEPGQGFIPGAYLQAGVHKKIWVSGAGIRVVGDWLQGGVSPQKSELRMVKEVTRAAIAQLTQGRALNSRDIFKSLRRSPTPQSD